MTAPLAPQIGDLRLNPRQITALRPDMLHQQFTRRIKAHPPWQAFEHGTAELLFKALYPPIERRRGQVAFLGGPPDRPRPHNRFDQLECLEMSDVSPLSVERCKKCIGSLNS